MGKPNLSVPKGVNPHKSKYTTFMFRGDCLEHLKVMDNASVDMILCDLPYGVTHNPHDKRIPFEPLWKEYESTTHGLNTREFGVTRTHS